MANLIDSVPAQFRHVDGIEKLPEAKLNDLGYYRGFPCPHNHVIRDSTHHWCYECAKKILSNVCGFDINYLHTDYKHKYAKLWAQVNVTFPDECWYIRTTPKRVCLPSYRSEYSKQKSENVNMHKAIYQCAWGDVGAMVVTRLCGNKKCCNPLHMVSSFNRNYPPQTIVPCELQFQAEKLMLYSQGLKQDVIETIVRKTHKNPIANPEFVKARPEYNE